MEQHDLPGTKGDTMKTGINRTIVFHAVDGKTTIRTKIRDLERHVQLNAKYWVGTQEEFRRWAGESMAHLLRNLSGQVTAEFEEENPSENALAHQVDAAGESEWVCDPKIARRSGTWPGSAESWPVWSASGTR
jgi:hypothetical protein